MLFPHNSRNISARVTRFAIGLIAISASLFVLFLNHQEQTNNPQQFLTERLDILTNLSSAASHDTFAKALWFSGNQTLAKAELALKDHKDPTVLGTHISAIPLPQEWLKDNADRSTQISKLEELLKQKPTYRDGYLQLALLYYDNDNLKKAKEIAQKALFLDPQSVGAKDILDAIAQAEKM